MTRNACFAVVSAMAVAALSVAGCGADEGAGSPAVTEEIAAAPAGPTPGGGGSPTAPGGAYRYVDGLCGQIDFGAVEAILPFSGTMQESGRNSGPYSAAHCVGTNEPHDGTIASGTTRVDVQWLPVPRL